jgi:outer membrane biosynthesis protein TonB
MKAPTIAIASVLAAGCVTGCQTQGAPGAVLPANSAASTSKFTDVYSALPEHGATVVRVCLDNRGYLVKDPSVVTSSGDRRLDDAALRLAKLGDGKYRPATEDGKPVPSCFSFNVSFDLDPSDPKSVRAVGGDIKAVTAP